MKSPPVQHPDDECRDQVEAFIAEHGRAATSTRGKARVKSG
jgi:hypothetical protein